MRTMEKGYFKSNHSPLSPFTAAAMPPARPLSALRVLLLLTSMLPFAAGQTFDMYLHVHPAAPSAPPGFDAPQHGSTEGGGGAPAILGSLDTRPNGRTMDLRLTIINFHVPTDGAVRLVLTSTDGSIEESLDENVEMVVGEDRQRQRHQQRRPARHVVVENRTLTEWGSVYFHHIAVHSPNISLTASLLAPLAAPLAEAAGVEGSEGSEEGRNPPSRGAMRVVSEVVQHLNLGFVNPQYGASVNAVRGAALQLDETLLSHVALTGPQRPGGAGEAGGTGGVDGGDGADDDARIDDAGGDAGVEAIRSEAQLGKADSCRFRNAVLSNRDHRVYISSPPYTMNEKDADEGGVTLTTTTHRRFIEGTHHDELMVHTASGMKGV